MDKETRNFSEVLVPRTEAEKKFWDEANDFFRRAEKDPSLIAQLEDVDLNDFKL